MFLHAPVVALLVISYSLVASQQQIHGVSDESGSDVRGLFTTVRQKRTGASILVALGKSAAETLLKGTKQLRAGQKGQKRFKKVGGFETALKDFYSVGPTDVRIFREPSGIITYEGKVGDRNLLLNNRGEKGKPILDIFDPKMVKRISRNQSAGEAVDRIVYTDKDRQAIERFIYRNAYNYPPFNEF